MNIEAIKSIYFYEMARTRRTLLQSVIFTVLSTALYFIVFGAAVGSRMQEVAGVSYGGFITPGLIMLALITQCISNGSVGIYFPKFTGTIYEILSAPVAMGEILLGYVGAAATKGMMIGLIILFTAMFFVELHIAPSGADAAVHDADRHHLQLGRLHHRGSGKEFRAIELGAIARGPPAHVPWRHLLFHRHAAALLAGGQSSQSGSLSCERFPLELF